MKDLKQKLWDLSLRTFDYTPDSMAITLQDLSVEADDLIKELSQYKQVVEAAKKCTWYDVGLNPLKKTLEQLETKK